MMQWKMHFLDVYQKILTYAPFVVTLSLKTDQSKEKLSSIGRHWVYGLTNDDLFICFFFLAVQDSSIGDLVSQ